MSLYLISGILTIGMIALFLMNILLAKVSFHFKRNLNPMETKYVSYRKLLKEYKAGKIKHHQLRRYLQWALIFWRTWYTSWSLAILFYVVLLFF